MLESDIFAMARRSFQASFGPVLRVCVDGKQGKSERQREKEGKRAGGSHFHAEKCSDGGRRLASMQWKESPLDHLQPLHSSADAAAH
jgi:hypothetical protein